MNEELKPCPFCGGEAVWWGTEDELYPYQVVCKRCYCGTDTHLYRKDAYEVWNRRVKE